MTAKSYTTHWEEGNREGLKVFNCFHNEHGCFSDGYRDVLIL
ncbi:type II toxin-antitoxin system CcdA family antitoxin [Pseudescherichia sp.]